ncbi:MAG: CsgG/HfaB family protein [Synergistaceae bacterium]|jgi:curli biogenesis system outer membrane secretion channel CsgG|nr:CsgG/HfaB family protein [Synergistaceae bacterium]
MKVWQRIFTVVLFFCLLAGGSAEAAEQEAIRLGVMSFTSKAEGVSNQQAALITDVFTRFLANSKSIALLERERLDMIGKEHKLNMSGLVDIGMAIEVGKLAGCQYVLLGAVTNLTEESSKTRLFGYDFWSHEAKATIDLRVVDVNTSEIVLSLSESGMAEQGGSDIQIDKNTAFESHEFGGLKAQAIEMSIMRLASQLREELAEEYPYVIAATGPRNIDINIGATEGIKKDDIYLIYSDGVEKRDIDGTSLGRERVPIAVVKVRDVQSRYSVCGVVAEGGNHSLIQRGDRVGAITKERARDLARQKAFVSNRPKRRAYDDTWDQISGNPPASNAPVAQVSGFQPQRASTLPTQPKRPSENNSTDPAKVIATYSISSGEANTRRIAHLNARKLNGQKAYDMYVDLANSFNGDYLAAYQAGEAARKLKKNDDAKTWYDKALAINSEYKPAQNAREKMK